VIEGTHSEKPMSDQRTSAPEPSGPLSLPDERRGAERLPLEPTSVCRVMCEGQEGEPQATVRDLSATGIGLLIDRPLKPGSVLILSLQTGDHRLARPLPVRVMHSSPATEGNWLVGCQFVRRLSDPELHVLLGAP
jgi:hypothetical protein